MNRKESCANRTSSDLGGITRKGRTTNRLATIASLVLMLGLLTPISAMGSSGPFEVTPTRKSPKRGNTNGGNVKQGPASKLAFILSGYESFPTRADLDKIAPSRVMEKMLIDLVTSGQEPIRQIRAVEALGLYNSPQVIEFLNRIAHGPTLPLPTGAGLQADARIAYSMQHRGIVALTKAAKVDALPYVEDLLTSSDLQIQLTTVSAIGKNCGAAGRAAIVNMLNGNKVDPLVVSEARKFL